MAKMTPRLTSCECTTCEIAQQMQWPELQIHTYAQTFPIDELKLKPIGKGEWVQLCQACRDAGHMEVK